MVETLVNYTGWVTDLTSANILLALDILPEPPVGTKVLIEIAASGSHLLIQGSVAGTLPGALVCDVVTLRSMDSDEAPRLKVDHMTYELVDGDTILHGMVNDISESGLGIIASSKLERDKSYEIRVATPLGETVGQFTVRHLGSSVSHYESRIGGRFVVEDRVDQARWRTLIQQKLAA